MAEELEKQVQQFSITNIEEAIDFAIRLKRAADKSEELLITFLCRLDDSRIWEGHTGKGPASFANWLKMHLNIDAIRYVNGRKTLESIASDVRSVIGFEAAKQVAHFDDPATRFKCQELCLEWAERNKGPVPRRTAVDIASALSPSNNPSIRADEKVTLRAEVHALRLRCSQLEEELARYRERFGDLETPEPARTKRTGKNRREAFNAPSAAE